MEGEWGREGIGGRKMGGDGRGWQQKFVVMQVRDETRWGKLEKEAWEEKMGVMGGGIRERDSVW